MVLALQSDILYGPVSSRRLGLSLGINLMPGQLKACSFDCVCCHYGRTRRLGANVDTALTELPTSDRVLEAVDEALRSDLDFAYLEHVTRIAPLGVQLYTTDRPVPSTAITRVPQHELRAFARRAQERTGVRFCVYLVT